MSAGTGGDAAGAASGVLGVVLGKALGFITLASLGQAFVLGLVGAIGGYLAKKGMDFLIKYIKQLIQKK